MKVIVFDSIRKKWVQLTNPISLLCAVSTHEVKDVLEKAERYAEEGLWVAGFLSYEAASAFDRAFKTKKNTSFPLALFGAFQGAESLQLDRIARNSFKLGEWKASTSMEKYIRDIQKIKNYIAAGRTYQVNYTYRLHTFFKGDPLACFLSLLENQKSTNAMFFEWDAHAICSLSPELFFQLKGDTIKSKPMKGTAPRGRFAEEDERRGNWLRNSEKNRAENVMIVDMIRNDLGRIARIGSVVVDSLFDVERYRTAWQMTSTVSAKTDASVPAIFEALFPCASITGAPKNSTMRIIAELEDDPRKIYTGCMGFLHGSRKAHFNVAIRTLLIDKKARAAEYGVGGGILWESEPQEEFAESQTKCQVLFSQAPRFELLESILWEKGYGYFLLPQHLKRLKDSACYFDFPFLEHAIVKRLDEIEAELSERKYKIRILLDCRGKVNIQALTLNDSDEQTLRLKISSIRVHSSDLFLFHKTTNRKIYQQARSATHDCDDVIFVNEKNQVTETTMYNLVVQRDGRLLTPALECGLLPGTFRQLLLEIGEIHEDVLSIDDLHSAEKIFCINSVRRWREAILL